MCIRDRLIGMVVSTFFNFDGSDIFVCLYYVIVIFIAGACVLTENANIRPVSYTHLDVYKRQGLSRVW